MKEVESLIRSWVEKSYGESEASNPSWSIEELVKYLSQNIR